MKMSVVIPAYNEEETIGEVLADTKRYFKNAEIILVNDCSTDKTKRIARKSGSRVFTNSYNQGHAKSVITGLKKSRGDVVLYMDADGQIKPWAIDFDLISGYRVNRQDKFFRKVVSFILRMVIFLKHRYWIRDANCPYKMFKQSSLRFLLSQLPPHAKVPSIDMEILARRYGMSTLEIPVDHYPLKKPRTGSLQSINKKSMGLFMDAFWEVIQL